MDTRNKIKPLKDLNSVLADSKWIAIAGFFDPLTSIQASRLADIAKKGHNVLAIVLAAPDCLLPADARAALVAAVRGVSAVVVANAHEWRSVITKDANVTVVDDLQGDKRRSEEFVQYVLKRQGVI
ncbi:MAG TPA: hypothetical protein VH601_18935 [Bryobacteraceae bacterium]